MLEGNWRKNGHIYHKINFFTEHLHWKRCKKILQAGNSNYQKKAQIWKKKNKQTNSKQVRKHIYIYIKVYLL